MNIAWKEAPLTERAAPTAIAISIRGSRILNRTVLTVSGISAGIENNLSPKACMAVTKSNEYLPINMEARRSPKGAIISIATLRLLIDYNSVFCHQIRAQRSVNEYSQPSLVFFITVEK